MAIYPNPTSESTTIGVDLTESQNLLIEAYDLNGIKVRTIADGYFKSGKSEIKLNTNALPPGIYVIKMNSNKSEISKLLVVN